MRPRRPSRARRRDALYRAVQRCRLDGIARGEIEPLSAREQYFLWTLQAKGRAEYADFIVPGLLFLAERELARGEPEGPGATESRDAASASQNHDDRCRPAGP